MNNPETITEKDRKNAQGCLDCRLCRRAREKKKGIAYFFVKFLERGLCPNCKAYEKVYGRKAHEPVPPTKEDS